MIATSEAFQSKEYAIKLFIILIIILSIFTNISTFDFYLNPKNSENIISIRDYVQKFASKNDNIFGDQSITSYISFTTEISMTSNHLDPYIDYARYTNETNIIENLEREKPKLIIDLGDYFVSNNYFGDYLKSKYYLDKVFHGISNYTVYIRK
jgi:hypothetical protein